MKDQLPGITLQDINQEFLKQYQPDKIFLLITGPVKDSSFIPASSEALATISKAENLMAIRYIDDPVASLTGAPTKGGRIVSKTKDTVVGTTDLVLSNGVTITLKPTDFKTGEIQMDGWRPGGYHQFPISRRPDATQAAKLANAMGVVGYTPNQLEKILAGKYVSLEPYLNDDEEGIEGNTTKNDLPTYLQLLYLYLTKPAFDSVLGRLYIESQQSYITNLQADPVAFFLDSLRRLMYNGNPWALGGELTLSELKEVNPYEAWKMYKQIFSNADGFHFTFVGDFNPDSVGPLLAYWIGGLPSTPVHHSFTDVRLTPEKGVSRAVIRKGIADQSRIELIFNGKAIYSPLEQLRIDATNALLNLTVFNIMREQMGKIYGGGFSGGMLDNAPTNDYQISAVLFCGPENVDTLVDCLLGLLEKTVRDGPLNDDLNKVKATLLEHNQTNMKQNYYWLDMLTNTWMKREDPLWIMNYANMVAAIEPEDIVSTLKKYYALNRYTLAILNPESLKSAIK